MQQTFKTIGLHTAIGSRSWQRKAKRVMDVAIASAALLIFLPLLMGTAAAVWITMGRPILFRQKRPGYSGRPFEILKFRTMRAPRVGEVYFRSDNERLTLFGRFLRKTSLDELPELVNVLKGEMSLVGPRPLLMEYLDKYTPEQQRRHHVLPGITGWAQVNGRQNIPFSKRLELDLWYVDNWSLRLDILILWRTAIKVIRSEGVVLGQKPDAIDDLGLLPESTREEIKEESREQ
jgi:sugar transferase EpsL